MILRLRVGGGGRANVSSALEELDWAAVDLRLPLFIETGE